MCVIFVSRAGIKNNALATVIMTVTAKAKITAMTKLMVQFAFQSIPFLLEVAAVLAAFVHPQSHSLPMLMGVHSLAAYLKLQVVWVYRKRLNACINTYGYGAF
ncbi:MAG: hypothetical protein ACRCT0_13245 [Plesiomonas shigelloides]